MKSKPLPINLNWKGGLTLNNFLVFYIVCIYYNLSQQRVKI